MNDRWFQKMHSCSSSENLYLPVTRTARPSSNGADIIMSIIEQSQYINTQSGIPNRNNNGSFVLRHFSPVCESQPTRTILNFPDFADKL